MVLNHIIAHDLGLIVIFMCHSPGCWDYRYFPIFTALMYFKRPSTMIYIFYQNKRKIDITSCDFCQSFWHKHFCWPSRYKWVSERRKEGRDHSKAITLLTVLHENSPFLSALKHEGMEKTLNFSLIFCISNFQQGDLGQLGPLGDMGCDD